MAKVEVTVIVPACDKCGATLFDVSITTYSNGKTLCDNCCPSLRKAGASQEKARGDAVGLAL